MNIRFAPMEGVTDAVFRDVHHRHFPGIDVYYTPFLSPTSDGPGITRKELWEVLPENNPGITLVPQLLTNRSIAFLRAAEILKDLGYREVNLNLGCPSGTVCAKGKGAGFLSRREELRQFLDEIFAACPLDISIKTRLGKDSPEEFPSLLELYDAYPVKELILHPRVQKQGYRGSIDRESYLYAKSHARAPLCLSGGVPTASALPNAPEQAELMLGRGLLADPSLHLKLRGEYDLTPALLEEYHGALFEATASHLGNERGTMFRMKEIWAHLILLFDGREALQRQLRKAVTVQEYQLAVYRILHTLPLRKEAEADWQ